jgi:hypothetical protein
MIFSFHLRQVICGRLVGARLRYIQLAAKPLVPSPSAGKMSIGLL